MKKTIPAILIILLILTCTFTATAGNMSRKSINDSWRFTLNAAGEQSGADVDDSAWRVLDLPHDWAIEGDFSEDNPAGTAGGALPGGVGWYRKRLVIEDIRKDEQIYIDFDGA